MPQSRTAIGIDIGAQALKAVALRKTGSRVSLLRAGTIELGDLAFLDESERKDLRVAELLRFLLRQARIRGRRVACGLAGRDYFVKYLHVPPATPDKLRKLIDYEVAEDPTAPGEQTADFMLLDLPTRGEEFTILLAMARNEAVRRRLGLLKHAGLATDGLTLNAIGLFNAYVHAMDEAIYNDKTTLLVDIGAQHLDVGVQRNAKLLFVRNLRLGGQRFSEALQEEYELPIREAEELKLAQGAILPRHFDVAADLDATTPEARLSAALVEPAEAIYNTLQATIKYCMAQIRMPDLRIDEVVLAGRGARLRGLREFLASRFHLPVELFDPLQGIDVSALPGRFRDDVVSDSAGYAAAIGLALRELDERRIRPITLLPEDVRKRREFLARDAFLYAAAAVFAVAFAAMFYSSQVATARAAQQDRIQRKQIEDGKKAHDEFELRRQRNDSLSKQAEALSRLLDTGRRCSEAVAILKRKLPPQLRIDSVQTVTQAPIVRVARGGARPEDPELTTQLIIEGRVSEAHDGKEIDIPTAKNIVDTFLHRLEAEKQLYRQASVAKYPEKGERDTQRTFKIVATFAAPFHGGSGQDIMVK